MPSEVIPTTYRLKPDVRAGLLLIATHHGLIGEAAAIRHLVAHELRRIERDSATPKPRKKIREKSKQGA